MSFHPTRHLDLYTILSNKKYLRIIVSVICSFLCVMLLAFIGGVVGLSIGIREVGMSGSSQTSNHTMLYGTIGSLVGIFMGAFFVAAVWGVVRLLSKGHRNDADLQM